jgi:ferric-dicitrate binding protein FerR (iron transport regulator)
MDKQYFYELVDKYLAGTATGPERQLVEAYYEELSREEPPLLSDSEKTALKEELYRCIAGGIHPSARRVTLWRRLGVRVAAASILLVLAGVGYWIWQGRSGTADLAALPQVERFKNDITPAHQGATLTLASGSKIRLDSAANGTLAEQGKTEVVKKDSTLSYTAANTSEAVVYNTVSTAKGQIYQIELADGTRVWLDAESSLHFPTSFPGPDRRVEITGQAYFEVARNPAQPFRVKSGDQSIDVLGTHFNVNGYDRASITTLLEGSLRVSSWGGSNLLAPGQQARVTASQIQIKSDADIDEALAWKNGRFRFAGASVEQIMTQLSRWYDIQVVYADKIPETFVATISRDVPLSRMLNLLEMTKEIAFTIDGNKITVYNIKQQE